MLSGLDLAYERSAYAGTSPKLPLAQSTLFAPLFDSLASDHIRRIPRLTSQVNRIMLFS